MPRQNRVNPFGDVIATPERGTMMGNRGRLHDELGRICRPWQLKRWIICLLEFRNRRRVVMAPDRYTELFFLDEATALAAGHRPCAECRRASYQSYVEASFRANSDRLSAGQPTAAAIDSLLHEDRINREGAKRAFEASIDGLPDGVFVSTDGIDAHLIWNRRLLAWSPGGYAAGIRTTGRTIVKVLTPTASVNAIRAGYAPEVHPSALRA